MAGLYLLAVTLRPDLLTFMGVGAANGLLSGVTLTLLARRVRRW
jgi:hypothetical protein